MKTHITQLGGSNTAVGAAILNPKVVAMIGMIILSGCDTSQIGPVNQKLNQQNITKKLITPEQSVFTKFTIKDGKFVANYESQTPEDAIDTKPSIITSEVMGKDGVKKSIDGLEVSWNAQGTKAELIVTGDADKLKDAVRVVVTVGLAGGATKTYQFEQAL